MFVFDKYLFINLYNLINFYTSYDVDTRKKYTENKRKTQLETLFGFLITFNIKFCFGFNFFFTFSILMIVFSVSCLVHK